VYGRKTNKNSDYPAVYGYVPANSTSTQQTAAVSGFNGSNGWGVYGKSSSNGSGVGGYADSGYGVFASSNSNYGLYAFSATSSAIYAESGSGRCWIVDDSCHNHIR
jgi:hypothetical protein